MVAVTNDADEILWSWHIWSTGYRLGSNDISVMNHAKTRTYKMMSQTLGQVGSTALLYQFGRKDPFRQQNATNTASGGTLAKSIQHPDVFYTNSGSDWCSESRTDWWDSGCKSYNSSTTSASTLKGNKTIYDPCPVGYRVPPDDAFTSFTTTGTNTDSESQINSPYPGMVDFIQNSNTYYFYTQVGSNTIAFPAFGGLNASSGKLLKNISYCYSACPSGYSTSRLLQFYAGGVHPQETAYSRALAGSIRPIREEIESIDKQTGHFEERVRETADLPEDRICVAGGMTVHYNGMSSCLFGGARNLLRNNLRASHFFNFRRICRSIALENDVHDLGYVLLKTVPPEPDGTLGVCVPNEEFEGICAFKKSFSADYVEYVGEYVLVRDKAKYFSYTHVVDKARAARASVSLLKRKINGA